ncbi:MAG: hypothetical protein K0S33_3226 [Bacteroidetes bacterium]|jgi:signal transduction histidine kinase|nr:hypothetical protein [Bacteroidota bacterium]
MDNQEVVLAIVCTTLLIFLLIAVLVLIFFISGRRRLQQEMEMAQAKLSFEKELRQVATEVSEQMMGQFAQELHDNIGQLLTAMHIHIENQKLDHPQQADGFKPIEIYLGEVSQQLRLLSRTLNNEYIGHAGLFDAMQQQVARLRALKRFDVHWTPVQGPSGLDKNQELVVFRIFQEISQNALRHSGAANLFIEINATAGNFEMEIRDDGRGFDAAELLRPHGNAGMPSSKRASGLLHILSRSEMAGLQCEITSSPGKGCRIKIKTSTL